MKNDWEIKKLGEVCEINIGRTPERGNFKMWDKEKKTENVWLSIADLNNTENGYISDSTEYVSDNAVPKMKLVKANTLLMSFKLTIGRCAITKRDLFTNEAIAALPILDKNLDLFFLKYYLENFDWAKLTEGDVKVKGKTLNKEKLKEVPITIPPLEEQKRIVKILDEKFAMLETVKANAKANLQNAKDLFQSQLTKAFMEESNPSTCEAGVSSLQNSHLPQHALKWEKKRLGDCGSFKNGMNFASTDTGYTIRSLGVGDFKNLYKIDNTEQLSEISLKAAPSEDYLLKDGDIVFVRSNGNKELVGRCLLVYPKNIPTTYSGFCIRFRKDYGELDADFLLHYMKAESSRKILNGKEGANISNLNQKILGDFEVPIPPLSEQKLIVEQLDSLSEKTKALCAIYENQIADCEELKKSLLAKAFEGNL